MDRLLNIKDLSNLLFLKNQNYGLTRRNIFIISYLLSKKDKNLKNNNFETLDISDFKDFEVEKYQDNLQFVNEFSKNSANFYSTKIMNYYNIENNKKFINSFLETKLMMFSSNIFEKYKFLVYLKKKYPNLAFIYPLSEKQGNFFENNLDIEFSSSLAHSSCFNLKIYRDICKFLDVKVVNVETDLPSKTFKHIGNKNFDNIVQNLQNYKKIKILIDKNLFNFRDRISLKFKTSSKISFLQNINFNILKKNDIKEIAFHGNIILKKFDTLTQLLFEKYYLKKYFKFFLEKKNKKIILSMLPRH